MSITTEPRSGEEAEKRSLRWDATGASETRAGADGRQSSALGKKIVLAVLLAAGGVLLIAAIASVVGGLGGPEQPLIFHTVTRGPLAITVTERGNLESQNNVKVRCEVDDIDGDGVHGTPILWIIDNGASVKEGEPLVRLESSKHQERLDRQILDTEKAKAEQIQTKAKHDNQKTQNETAVAEAELKVKLADMELEMYQDPEKGTYQLEVEEINRLIEDFNNQILEAQASLELKKNELRGIESLFKLGYKGKSELDRSRLEYLQAESLYAARLNKLKTQKATLKKKRTYEKDMQLLKLDGACKTGVRTQTQVVRDNEALLEQAKAAMEAADEALKKENELLARYRDQYENCEILAPADGMVAYASSSSHWRPEIRQGNPVGPRQHILSLPDLKSMQVQTAVHESVLDEVKAGLPATIRVDAFPDRSYRGSVQSVSVLPDQSGWSSSDTKVYKTVVIINEEVDRLKPGMTAVVEIHVDRLRDVLSVPVQAVVQRGKESWCYVGDGRAVDRRVVGLGRTNGKFVEIRKGLEEGDRVVLNPTAILDETAEEETPVAPEEDSQPPAEDAAREVAPQRDTASRDGAGQADGGQRRGQSGGAGERPQR